MQDRDCAFEPRGALLGQWSVCLHLGEDTVVEYCGLIGEDNLLAVWVNAWSPCGDLLVQTEALCARVIVKVDRKAVDQNTDCYSYCRAKGGHEYVGTLDVSNPAWCLAPRVTDGFIESCVNNVCGSVVFKPWSLTGLLEESLDFLSE